ncbi:MAG: hypothetical protein LQ349_001063 [Xanthoria aureola]|nr:MAG: hypothetical protein LQ349_001063 [Xanthoria aureola]
MHAAYLTALLGAAIAAAAPSLESRAAPTPQTVKFDDLRGVPGVVVNPVGPSGVYRDVFWPGFALDETNIPGVPSGPLAGILPRPGTKPILLPNGIAWGTTGIQTITTGPAAIDTNYAGSKVKYIDLKSFYLGCNSATKTSVTAVPASCRVAATCIRADGSKVGPQNFDFSVAPLQLSAFPKKFEPAGFTRCARIKFDNPVSKDALPVGAILAGLMDDVTLSAYR